MKISLKKCKLWDQRDEFNVTVCTCTETISELTGNIYLKLTKFQNKIALKDNNA